MPNHHETGLRRASTHPKAQKTADFFNSLLARTLGRCALLATRPRQGKEVWIAKAQRGIGLVSSPTNVRSASLQTERELLQQRLAVTSPEFKAKEVSDFNAKQKDLQDLSQQKQAMIQTGFVKARSQIELLLGPILRGLMKRHGADLLIDKKDVVLSNERGLDFTGAGVVQLNEKISSLKVDFVSVPNAAMKH